MSPPLMARAEFTSTLTSASVWSMTMAPPRGQGARCGVGRPDLVLDLEAREQRRVVAVALDAMRLLGHHVAMNWCACSKMSSVSIRMSPMSLLK